MSEERFTPNVTTEAEESLVPLGLIAASGFPVNDGERVALVEVYPTLRDQIAELYDVQDYRDEVPALRFKAIQKNAMWE